MVTFRFYLVSTAAFFLAMAVGVVVGSVLDEGLVTSLENRLDTVQVNLDETAALIDEKRAEIEVLERYVDESAPFAVEGRLEDGSALVVAEEGVDTDAVERLVLRLGQAGARVEGIVWLLPDWDLTDAELRGRLVEGAGIEPPDPVPDDESGERDGDAGSQLRREVWSLLVEETGAAGEGDAAPPTTGTPTTDGPAETPTDGTPVPDDAPPPDTPVEDGTTTPAEDGTGAGAVDALDGEVVSLLDELGLVRVERLDEVAQAGGPLVLAVVTGGGSELAVPGAAAAELAATAADGGVPTVLAEIGAEDLPDEERGSLIPGAAAYSTVDALDLVAGRVATVLALAEARDGGVGRYGLGPGVDGVLPRWQGP